MMNDAFVDGFRLGLNKNKKRNRSKIEIVRDMLSIVSVSVRKTRIMYQANLSYGQLEKYLGSLLEQGLVECDDDSCYLITWKGKEFLQIYRDHLERCKKIGEDIGEARKKRLTLENMCFNDKLDSRRITSKKETS